MIRRDLLAIVVRIDDVAPRSDRYFAMTKHHWENYEPAYPCGRGSSPLAAVEDLFWAMDLDPETPCALEIEERKPNVVPFRKAG